MALAGGRTEDFATGDLIVGAHFEPGGKMLDRGKLAQVRSALADDLLRQVNAEAVYRGEVDAGNAPQMLPDVDGRIFGQVLAVGATLVGRQRRGVLRSWVGPIGTDGRVGALNRCIAGGNLAGVKSYSSSDCRSTKRCSSRQVPVRDLAISASDFLQRRSRRAASLWLARDRVGTRIRWYAEVEEVER